MYGGLGQVLVILVDATAVETTDQLFDALVLGFCKPAPSSIDRRDRRFAARERLPVRRGERRSGSAVAPWRDDDNVGIVLEMPGDPGGTRRLLWTIHDTVVG